MNGPTFTPQSAPPAAPSARRAPLPPRPAPKPAKPDPAAGGMMVLTYLRLHWMAILFCGLLLGGGLAYAAWTLLPSKYESYALLHVASTPTGIGAAPDPNRGKTDFVTQVKTTAQLIKTDFVLNAALNDPKYRIADLPTLKEQKDPIKYLDEKLVVGSSDTEVIKISLEGDRPDDIQKIVDAVKDAYYQEVVMKEIKQKKSLMLSVEQAKATLESAMKKMPGFEPVNPPLANSQMAQRPGGVVHADVRMPAVPMPMENGVLQSSATIPVPPAAVGVAAAAIGDTDLVKDAKFPMLVHRIGEYEIELAQFPTLVKERQAVVDSIKKQIDALKNAVPSQESLARAEKDPDVMVKQVEAYARRREYGHLRDVINDPNAERISRAKAAADAVDAEATKLKAEKAKSFETIRTQPQMDQLYRSLDAAEISVANYKERERVTQQMLADARKEVAETPPDIKRGDEKGPLVDPQKTDLLTHDDMYRRLTAQLIGLDFELQSPPRVRPIQDASVPTQKDTKKQILATVMAGLMGFGLIGLIAVGYEMKVKKVSSLGELKTTPAPVVGVVPWQPDGSVLRDPVKRADVNEAIDKLRAYVAQTWLSRGATTVAVTSPIGDEGKAFTAFGLASSLAQAGYKTLLVDFDLRHPSLHTFAGVTHGTPGVCELLRGETDPRSAVLGLPNGLYFLPAGQWSDESRQAAVGGRLENLLARLREPFDCVVLHSHALLTAAESVEVARRADVVLLCTLYRETRLPLLKRATERVAAMEVPYSGLVYLGATANEALC